MKIEIESIEVSAFRDIGLNQEIKMPGSGVCCIIGKNEDDGGSNASGKTSFITSVTVNLFGPDAVNIPTAKMKNRHLKSPARIQGVYRVDGEKLTVDRTIGGKLVVKFKDSTIEGKVEDVQSKLNEILKLTPDQFMTLTHKEQGGDKFFLLMKDSEKKEFLGSFFDVSPYEKAKDEADLLLKGASKKLSDVNVKMHLLAALKQEMENSLNVAEKELNSLKSEDEISKNEAFKNQLISIEQERSTLLSLLSDEAALKQSPEYKTAESSHYAVQQSNADIMANIDKQLEECDKQRSALLEKLVAPLEVPSNLTKVLTDIEEAIKVSDQLALSKNKLSQQAASFRSQIEYTLKKIIKNPEDSGKMNCNSCGQQLPNAESVKEHINKHNESLIAEARQIEAQMIECNDKNDLIVILSDVDRANLAKARDQILSEISLFKAQNSNSSINKEIEAINKTVAMLNSSKRSAANAIESSEKILASAINSVKLKITNSINSLSKDEYVAQKAIQDYQNKKEKAEKAFKEASDKIAKNMYEYMQCSSEKISLEIEQKVLETASYILSANGFLGYIFDGILEDLNKEINVNLKMIPNVRQYSLQFTPDKLVKSTGAVNKTINYEIKSGKDDIVFKTLSGGEQLGILIAVEEALDTVLSSRLGIQLGWKILDEQFSFIDENSKEAILNFYKSKDKLYLVVDHASEFNAAVDSQIIVRKRNGIAYVSVA
jgi:DNA repair exonuclease SbcCD ATPase subunit